MQRQTFIAFMCALAALTAVLALVQNNRYRSYCEAMKARGRPGPGADIEGNKPSPEKIGASVPPNTSPGQMNGAPQGDPIPGQVGGGAQSGSESQQLLVAVPGQPSGASKTDNKRNSCACASKLWKEVKELGERSALVSVVLDLCRALASTTVFLSLCMLTGPGPTYLFPNPARSGTQVPPYVGPCVNVFLVAVLGSLAKVFPGLVESAQPDK